MAVAVFLGFVINVILGFFIPFNELIGGAVAGYIAGGSLGGRWLPGSSQVQSAGLCYQS